VGAEPLQRPLVAALDPAPGQRRQGTLDRRRCLLLGREGDQRPVAVGFERPGAAGTALAIRRDEPLDEAARRLPLDDVDIGTVLRPGQLRADVDVVAAGVAPVDQEVIGERLVPGEVFDPLVDLLGRYGDPDARDHRLRGHGRCIADRSSSSE
jgi:hypothetical protein